MFAALSGANAAILRASSRKEMFQFVCEAVASVGNSLGAAAIFLKQRDSSLLKPAAAAGLGRETIEQLEISTDPGHLRGQGLGGPAFREQEVKIAYDLAADDRTRSFVDDGHPPMARQRFRWCCAANRKA